MEIVVIDNFQWTDIDHGVNIPDKAPFDYIPTLYSYKADEKKQPIKTPRTFEDVVGDLSAFNDSSEIVFLINVHCTFANGNSKKKTSWYLQEQHGISIYRHLLKAYEKNAAALKVAFFSPIPQDDLIKLKPENSVLAFHNFFSVPFKWKDCVAALEKTNENNDWRVFNNASENLLSGYKMFVPDGTVSKKVETGKKKILFVDDQSNEWKAAFAEVFNEKAIAHLSFSNQKDFKTALAEGKVLKEVKANLNSEQNPCNIILSDFYLKEDHDPGRWMNKESIEDISGFNLFHSIRETDKGKGIPYIMHTSSNKISYYKVFDQSGVDDWIVKDIRPDTSAIEKKDNYILFKKTIEFISKQNIYKKMQDFWEKIQQIKKIQTNKWWYSPEYNAELLVPILIEGFNVKMVFKPVNNDRSEYSTFTKGDIVSILESSWFAIRRQINKETDYENEGKISATESEAEKFLATSICNNIGKIVEMFGIKSGAKDFSYLTNFLLQMRNSASHASDYEYFELNDVFICLDYLTNALFNYDTLKEFQTAFPDRFIASHKKNSENNYYEFPCALLWLYLQFYNEEFSKSSEYGRTSMKTRINKLHKTIKGNGVIEEVVIKTKADNRLNDWFKKTFERENVSACEIPNADPLKISIPFKL